MTAAQQQHSSSSTVQVLLNERAAERDRSLNEEATQRALYAIAEENHKKQMMGTKAWYATQLDQAITPAAGRVVDAVLEEEKESRSRADRLQ